MAIRHLNDLKIEEGDLQLKVGSNAAPQSYDKIHIGGDGLASADAAIYIGNRGDGTGYGYRMYYYGTGSGNNNKLIFKSENLGSPVDMLSFTADGNATFSGTITTASHGSSTNWKQAYDNHITGVAVTGTSTKTITLTQRDGGTISANFSDQSGSGGIDMTNGSNNRVVTAIDSDSVNAESGLLFGGSYLEITPGNIATPLQVKRTSASTRQVNLLLSANDGSAVSEGFLGIDSGANLRYGASSNTSLNSLVLTEDNLDFVVNSSTNSAIIRLAGGGTNFTSFSVGGEGDAVTISSTSSSLTVGLREFIEEKYIYTSNDSNAVYMPMVKGGMYGTSASSVTGQILIKIPSYKTNMMQQFYVDIYEYETGESMTFRVSGYNYNDTNGTWYNTSVVNLSDDTDRDFTVRFGADTTNGFQYVAIGETNSTWSYPQVNVRDFYGGYATSEADTQGSFNVSFVTTTPGSTSQTHTNNYVAGDYNNLKNKPTIPTVNNGQLTVQGTGALGGSGTFTANQSGNTTISISHDDTSSQGSVDNSNGTVIQDVTLDGYGHVTALGSVNLDNRYYQKSESESRYVNVTGDTMTGNLNIGANLSLTGDSRILNLAGGSTTSSQSRVIVGEQGLYGVSFRWNSGAELEFDGFWNSSVTGSRNRDLGSIDVNNRVWYLNNNVTVGGTLTTPNLTIGSGNKIKFANNDFIRFDDANGVGRFHFDCDGSTNNASVQAATFVGALSGNATTSTTLATARTIAGSSFDGSADIDISYNNLTNTPTIPTVNNATLTVQGTGALGGSGTFTANQSSNATISISHDDTSSQSSVNNSSGTVIQDVTLDGYGHVTGLGSVDLDGRYFRRYQGSVSNVSNSGYTTAFTINGGNLASHISFSVQGTTSNVVVSNLIDLNVNHHQDIMLEALSGVYTQLSVKVISNNNEDFAVQLKTNHANAVTLYIEIVAYGGEVPTFTSSHSFTGATLEATLPPGKYIKGNGGDSGDLEIAGVFRGDGSGLTSISYNDLDNKPTIPSQPTNYLRDDAFDQGIGLYLTGGSYNAGTDTATTPLVIDEGDFIKTKDGGYLRNLIGKTTGDIIQIGQSGTSLIDQINFLPGNAGNNAVKVNGNTVWNAGNDGSGSGLDADLLDGQNGTYYAKYNDIRSLGTQAFTGGSNPNITTAQVISEIESDGGFDSFSSVFKTSWSYAGNYNLTDAGRFTETAGTSWITWTDNSSDSTRGNITALAICPNTGGSANKVFIYNDQGSSYSPGWREVWTNASDGAGSGLDADLLDGQQGSYYLDYNNFVNTPTVSGISQSDADTRYINATGDTMGGTLNMGGNTLTLHTSGGSPGLKSYYGTVNVVNGSSAGTLYVGTGSANASGSVYATTIGGGSNTKVVYSTSHHRYYVGSSTEEMRLESDGDLHVEGDVTAYSTTVSDIRLKDNVVTINNALDKVCKLRGVEYTWNKGSRKDTRDLGVIAQEVEKVLPEIVKEKKMPLIDDSDTTYKSVDYEKITAVLVEAVKEQQAQIDELVTILEEVTKQLNNGNNI